MQQVRRQPQFDGYGLLRDPADWTPDLARHLARLEGLMELGPQHWSFLKALRDYYQRFHVPPPTARLCHELHLEHGCGPHAVSQLPGRLAHRRPAGPGGGGESLPVH